MRISLLQQREPFAEVFAQTFSRYLSAVRGEPVAVRWQNGSRAACANEQPWFCNIYLNAIFPTGVRREAFDPLRREFSRSRTAWLRPAQRAYVWTATSAFGAPWLAQARLHVSPPVPGAEDWIVVPGNHKLRILDSATGTATCIHKEGFDPDFFQREIKARRQAAGLGLSVPRLLSVDEAGGWFVEQYVSGTPLNRLPDPGAADHALDCVLAQLKPLYQLTRSQQPAGEYAEGLARQCQEWIEKSHLFDISRRSSLKNLAARCLASAAPYGRQQVALAQCHGDFQAGNILVNKDAVWLIDWEYSRVCQIGYDRLVYHLDARRPRGLAERLRAFASGMAPAWNGGLWVEKDERRLASVLFGLEELALHLRENANPLFTRTGAGLDRLERELPAALDTLEHCLA